MKRYLAWLLVAAALLGMCGCAAQSTPEEETVPETSAPVVEVAAETEPAVLETEPEILEGSLYLKVSSITFSVVGETDDIYVGLIPRELVTWESEDPSVIAVENGVLTAVGVGTTTVRATYYDRQVECTAGCLAESEEALLELDDEILGAPTRILPEMDMEVPCTYFDNAAMVGDSITYVMRQFEAKNDYLGNTTYLCRGGASLHGFLLGSVKLFYRGQELRLEDAIAVSEVERIYVLIGTSDIVDEKTDEDFFNDWNAMLGKIREKNEDLEVVLLSILPSAGEGKFTQRWNARVEGINEQLKQFAQDNDCGYLDLAYYIRDHHRAMPAGYSQDMYHMEKEGCVEWMKALRFYAQLEAEGGKLS